MWDSSKGLEGMGMGQKQRTQNCRQLTDGQLLVIEAAQPQMLWKDCFHWRKSSSNSVRDSESSSQTIGEGIWLSLGALHPCPLFGQQTVSSWRLKAKHYLSPKHFITEDLRCGNKDPL